MNLESDWFSNIIQAVASTVQATASLDTPSTLDDVERAMAGVEALRPLLAKAIEEYASAHNAELDVRIKAMRGSVGLYLGTLDHSDGGHDHMRALLVAEEAAERLRDIEQQMTSRTHAFNRLFARLPAQAVTP